MDTYDFLTKKAAQKCYDSMNETEPDARISLTEFQNDDGQPIFYQVAVNRAKIARPHER